MILKIYKHEFRPRDQKEIYISCNKCYVFRILKLIKKNIIVMHFKIAVDVKTEMVY